LLPRVKNIEFFIVNFCPSDSPIDGFGGNESTLTRHYSGVPPAAFGLVHTEHQYSTRLWAAD